MENETIRAQMINKILREENENIKVFGEMQEYEIAELKIRNLQLEANLKFNVRENVRLIRQIGDYAMLQEEILNTLSNVHQVLTGWHSDGTHWTEFDESVRKDVEGLQTKLCKLWERGV